MPKQLDVDWGAVQRDRDAGISVPELVKKYGIGNATIYHHLKSNGRKRAGGGQKRTPIKIAARGRLQWSCWRRPEPRADSGILAQAA